MSTCRGCGDAGLRRVLDIGNVPAADHFPLAAEPIAPEETAHPLAMDLCTTCGLAQLADDDTVADEPRGVEPQVLRDQAADAVERVAESGWLRGRTVREFGSPHGGTWLPLLADRGFVAAETADVVLDCFGIMHDPDQREAFRLRGQRRPRPTEYSCCNSIHCWQSPVTDNGMRCATVTLRTIR